MCNLAIGATLTGTYGGYDIEQEAVASDPGLFQMNITGGKTRGVDGAVSTRVCLPYSLILGISMTDR